jgi:superfamily II DNA or RNA helicase
MAIAAQFKEQGIHAEHIDGETDAKHRDDVYRALQSGEVRVVSNANVYVEGSDFPFVSCVIDAQPTKSVGRYLQKGGRGMRTCEGKQDLHYHDHAGNVYNHGRLEMKREWELVSGKEQLEKFQKERDGQPMERSCPECGAHYTGMICPRCGYEYVREGREVDYLPADLAKMTVEQTEKIQFVPSPAEKQRWFKEALDYANERGKKPGWAAHCYEAKWKEGMPPREWMRMVPHPASEAVRKYMGNQLKRAGIRKRSQA